MYYEAIADFEPLIFDVVTEYQTLRRSGSDRGAALKQLEINYSNELSDTDTKGPVRIGMAFALCQKKELVTSVKEAALESIQDMIRAGDWGEEGNRLLLRAQKTISQDKMLGQEAVYGKRRIYDPNWQIGDTFIHPLTIPRTKDLGIEGWYLIMRKAGDYTDREGKIHQLVYLTLCPPEKIPPNDEELQKLGYLKMTPLNDYLCQLEMKNKKEELFCGFKKIGNYGKVKEPVKQNTNRPLIASYVLPTSPSVNYPTSPSFEEIVLSKYRSYGIQSSV